MKTWLLRYAKRHKRVDLLPDPRWFIPAVILYALLIAAVCQAEDIDLDAYADAIFKAENSVNHPYGILMDGCDKNHPDYCRKLCKNTVHNTLTKYRAQRCKPGEDDLTCLANRYCPLNSDTDNGTCQYWKSNVKYFLNNPKWKMK